MSPLRPGIPLIKTQIRSEHDIVVVRQKTRRLTQLLGFDNQDQARVATAVSELARNVYQYAKTGTVEFFFNDLVPQTLFVKLLDNGPGIKNLRDILDGVYVSKSGMGVGLLGSKKLTDFFEIETGENGTQVVIGKSLNGNATPIKREQLPNIAFQLADREPINTIEEVQKQNQELISILKDLTSAHQEIKELNNELEETNRGVLALYAELDDKANALKKANEVKTSFLSNMTHEFRTPLSSIISLTRLLLERVDGDLSEEQERQVNYIRKSGESLLELVNDLLDLAKVESGRISINSSVFQIDELMGGLRGMFRPILGEKSPVEFSIHWDPDVSNFDTDQAKLTQILRNLISNAIKFTEAGQISVHAHREPNDIIHFVVSDTGIGIKDEHLETIFEDFGQINSKLQRVHKGTGLGLPLSRKLARLLGGDIWVTSTIGEGSKFHIRIPRVYDGEKEAILIGEAPVKNKNTETDVEPGASHFKILLIDDDEPSRYILKELIRSQIAASFIEAKSGSDGLHKMKLYNPDVVFLDLSMPDMSGFDVLEMAKSDDALRLIPMIVNTAMKLTDADLDKLHVATAVIFKDASNHRGAIVNIKNALSKAGFDYRDKEMEL